MIMMMMMMMRKMRMIRIRIMMAASVEQGPGWMKMVKSPVSKAMSDITPLENILPYLVGSLR